MKLVPLGKYLPALKSENIAISTGIKTLKNIEYCLSVGSENLWPLVISLVFIDRNAEQFLHTIDLEGEVHYRLLPSLEMDLKDAIGFHGNAVKWQDAIANGLGKLIAEDAKLSIDDLDDETLEINLKLAFGAEVGKTILVSEVKDALAIKDENELSSAEADQ